MRNVVIIGGGAAGCFCAAELSRMHPDWRICVLEAGQRLMAKLAVTGGGRCNITNSFESVCGTSQLYESGDYTGSLRQVGLRDLERVYPRGAVLMKRLLSRFGPEECLQWFGERGVRFVTQPDGCVFPESQDAMQIVRTLERAMRDGGVKIYCGCKVTELSPDLTVTIADSGGMRATGSAAGGILSAHRSDPFGMQSRILKPDAVIVTTGGGTSHLLEACGLELVKEVPSLFTLKLADAGVRSLMGTVVDNVSLGLAGTRFRSNGTLLLTDWGVSGPATLRLSSYAARWLAENQYKGSLLVNWLDASEAEVRKRLEAMSGSGRTVANSHPAELTDRLWKYLVERAGIAAERRWTELGNKGVGKLINALTADTYEICGRARFKEEFVTCGGVSLSEVKPENLESRRIPGLYLAGEVLDIDAVTGGYNLQAAWSTAWTIAHGI